MAMAATAIAARPEATPAKYRELFAASKSATRFAAASRQPAAACEELGEREWILDSKYRRVAMLYAFFWAFCLPESKEQPKEEDHAAAKFFKRPLA